MKDISKKNTVENTFLIEIDAKSEKLENFSDLAISSLKKGANEYVVDIITESNTIESGIREDGAETEIVSTNVKKAINNYRYSSKRQTRKDFLFDKILTAINILSTATFGHFIGSNRLNAEEYGYGYLAVFVISLCTTLIITAFKEREK